MPETIITKQCRRCKQIKPLSEFYKNKLYEDGHHYYCKKCSNAHTKAYSQTVKGKLSHKLTGKKYLNTEKGKEVARNSTKRFNKTQKGTIYAREYRQNQECKLARKKEYLENAVKHRSRHAITNGVVSGKIEPASNFRCSCGKTAQQYHHHEGYAYENRFNVIPVCIPCHGVIHRIS